MKIGHNFELPKEYKSSEKNFKTIDIGGYKVISDIHKGVLIQGIKLINIFDLPMDTVGIIHLDEDMQNKIKNFPFEVEKHHLVYQVTFNDYAWYFNRKEDAYAMMELILSVKEHALHQKFLDKHRGETK